MMNTHLLLITIVWIFLFTKIQLIPLFILFILLKQLVLTIKVNDKGYFL